LDDGSGRTVEELQLCDKFGRESSVAIANQGEVTPETCQLLLLSGRVATECISFGDKALDRGRCSEDQGFVLVGIQLADLSVGFLCRVAHEPMLSTVAKFCSASRDFYPLRAEAEEESASCQRG